MKKRLFALLLALVMLCMAMPLGVLAEEAPEESDNQFPFDGEAGDNDVSFGNISGCKDGHDWGEWEVTVDATCTATGERKHTCTRCQKVETETIPAAHKLTKTEAVAATCGKAGNIEYYTCSVCGKYFSDEKAEHEIEEKDLTTPATGEHTYDDQWTYVDVENHAHSCTVCHEATKTEAHTWDEGEVTTPATETKPGEKTYTCTVCKGTRTETIPATGDGDNDFDFGQISECKDGKHTWGEWEVTKEADCTTPGERTRTCAKCKKVETETIPAAHKLTKTEAKAATCEENGNIEYYTCSACGKHFDDAEGKNEIAENSWVIEAKGHDLTKTEAKVATCEEAGNDAYYTCSVCGKHFSDAEGKNEIEEDSWVIKAEGHKLTKTEAKAATCVEAGNDAYYTCSVCGKHFRDAEGKNAIEDGSWVTPATGEHTYGAWKSADESNHTHTCTVCHEATETEPHTWNEGVVTTEPTETAAGLKTYTCTLCEATKTETIPATGDGDNDFPYGDISGCKDGHDGEWTVETDATCTTPGKKTRTCTRCGMIETVTVDALGHKMTRTEAKDATCLENGNLEYYTCSVCHKVFKDAAGEEEYGENEWIIEAPGHHSWSDWTPVEGKDQHTRTCSACNETETKDHNWDEGVVTTEPTETEPGEKKYTCPDCGATKKEEIPPTGQVIKGDLNGDGVVDEEDVDYLLMYIIFGADEYPVNQSCDFDGNDVVDEGDVDYLLMYVIFGGEEYPLS